MSTFDQFREGLQTLWDNIAEGWQQLRESAGNALTRFNPVTRRDNLQTAQDISSLDGARWALLTIDMEESEDSLSVRLEIPGMEPGDFDIAVIENQLIIRGEKQAKREHRSGRYHVMECAYGVFERTVPLPVTVDDTRARARYKRGVLTVNLPKSQQHQRRRIEVHHS
ncbi:MAG: Hsp20/alpha crystallin family protein [Gammaproteobacteria bacterium]